jgi:two-component system CheB/CheR fusion protein
MAPYPKLGTDSACLVLKAVGSASRWLRASRLADDEHELNELYKVLLIGVTKFSRDPDPFEALRDQVITKLFSQPRAEPAIRVWATACASGEEAYSLAILIDEELRRTQLDVPYKIFATDVHPGMLRRAGKGIYSAKAVSELSAERRGRYFTQTSAGYRVNRELRNALVFAPHNLINDAPYTQIDLVTCRNMLIYLQPQKRVLLLFHFALKADGFLFLGSSETPGELRDEFCEIDW